MSRIITPDSESAGILKIKVDTAKVFLETALSRLNKVSLINPLNEVESDLSVITTTIMAAHKAVHEAIERVDML